MGDLDSKLREILETYNMDTTAGGMDEDKAFGYLVVAVKQAFAESSEWVHVSASQETQAAIANTMLGHKVMTGQEWYDRFKEELHGTKFASPTSMLSAKLGESTYKKKDILDAARKASNLDG